MADNHGDLTESGHTGTRISLRDIAERVGVHYTTVSRALANNPSISEPVRRKVQATAERMGYRPDPMLATLAQYRQSKRQPTFHAEIAWINCWPIPENLLKLGEFAAYWRGASKTAEKLGYRIEEIVWNTPHTAFDRLEQILMARNITGLLFPPQPSPSEIDWSAFPWSRYYVIRFGYSGHLPDAHVVTSDQTANGLMAYNRIRERGYERIGFVQGAPKYHRFLAGFLQGQTDIDSRLRIPPLFAPDLSRDSEYRASLHRWIRRYRPDAIFTDIKGLDIAVKSLGYRVPADIAMASTTILDGGLDSGIDQNPEEIGRVAMETLAALIHNNLRGIPSIVRHTLVMGRWVNGTSLPPRPVADPASRIR